MNVVVDFVSNLAFACCLYVVGAALCRLRVAHISKIWVLLYTFLFANALWCLWDALTSTLTLRDMSMMVMAGIYIFLTRKRWAKGVPEVARRVS